MNNETIMFISAVTTAGLFVLGLWLRAEYQRRQIEKRLWSVLSQQGVMERSGEAAIPGAATARRVEQIEGQLEQMVHQIDRLAESQEFLSRVLTDRIDQLPDPRLRTPH